MYYFTVEIQSAPVRASSAERIVPVVGDGVPSVETERAGGHYSNLDERTDSGARTGPVRTSPARNCGVESLATGVIYINLVAFMTLKNTLVSSFEYLWVNFSVK